jgi:hypothetical protein
MKNSNFQSLKTLYLFVLAVICTRTSSAMTAKVVPNEPENIQRIGKYQVSVLIVDTETQKQQLLPLQDAMQILEAQLNAQGISKEDLHNLEETKNLPNKTHDLIRAFCLFKDAAYDFGEGTVIIAILTKDAIETTVYPTLKEALYTIGKLSGKLLGALFDKTSTLVDTDEKIKLAGNKIANILIGKHYD